MKESWAPVAGFEGLYEVSDQGRVKAVARMAPHPRCGYRRHRERILKPSLCDTGYLQVSLHKDGRQRTVKVHRLVAEAFLGPRPADMDIRHGSTDRTDNRAANLSYGTRADNEADKVRDGVSNRGERCGSAKLTEQQVLEARHRARAGELSSVKQLAAEWGVSVTCLHDAISGRRWAWLEAG
jgi:hypothetical protein